MSASRDEIIKHIIDSKLVEECVKYQTIKAPKYYVEELTQETWLWLLTYDIEKLRDAYEKNHLNALITRYLINQFRSKNSPFYRLHKKWDEKTVDLTPKFNNIPDD